MGTLVVLVDPAEVGLLTLSEWDRLRERRVYFESLDHPLAQRLRDEGVEVIEGTEGLSAGDEQTALVAAPGSAVAEELAHQGAEFTVGLAVAPDPLSAVRGAAIARRAQSSLGTLALVMARLRGADGCPWDAKQTHESLQPHLLEEAHEVLETIDRGAVGAELEDELGDLLLQVYFHAQLADDDRRFDIAGVADVIVAKLIRRHPHVFGDVTVQGADDVVRNWEQIKKDEGRSSAEGPFAGIPVTLPALTVAYKTLKKAAGIAPPVQEAEAVERARRALEGEELGEALFWIVAVARARGVDPEGALRRYVRGFQSATG